MTQKNSSTYVSNGKNTEKAPRAKGGAFGFVKSAAARLSLKRSQRREDADSLLVSAPEKEIGRLSYAAGLLCRAAVIFLSVFGSVFLLYDSVGIYLKQHDFRTYSIPMYAMILICLAVSLVSAFTSYNKVTAPVVPLSALALSGVYLAVISKGNILILIENSARRLYNDILYGASLKGYTTFSRAMVNDTYSFPKETLCITMTLLLAASLALVMYFAVARKARLWLFALSEAVFAVPILMLNISGSNAPFAVFVSACVGFLALWASDRRYNGSGEKRKMKKEKKRERAEQRKNERYEKRLEDLRLREAAQEIYDVSLDAGMDADYANEARKSVLRRAKESRREEKRLAREREKSKARELKKLKKEEKKKAKEEARLERKRNAALPKNEVNKLKKERRDKLRDIKREKRKERRKVKDAAARNRAAGGYAGAVACAVSLIALSLPSAIFSKPFPVIGFIEKHVEHMRNYADDVLMGDDVDLSSSGLYSSFEKMDFDTLSFDERTFDGTEIYLLDSVRQDPVYLKSRSALSFDIESGKWSFPTSGEVMDFRDEFGEGFSSDDITTEAYSFLYPPSNNVPPKGTYLNYSRFGFTVQQIHVFRANGKSRLLFTPSVMNTKIGILERGKDTPADDRYVPYFDGIYTTRFYGEKTDGYSAVSYIYSFRRPDISEVFDSEGYMLDLTLELAEREMSGESAELLADEYKMRTASVPAYNDIGERYLLSMSDSEKEEFLSFAEREKMYREYAENTYTKVPVCESVSSLAEKIISDAGGALSRHETVTAVIGYLNSDEFEYTLAPKSPGDDAEYSSVLENFLFDTKEGYCSHFATSAVMLLRYLGVPARYVEGYAATDWAVMPGTMAVSKYGCELYDSDAHTWLEVYYDGIGWIPYEATKTFVGDMYTPLESTVGDSGAADTDAEDEESGENEENKENGENEENGDEEEPAIPFIPGGDSALQRQKILRQIRILITVVLSVLAVYFAAAAIVKIVKKRAEKAAKIRSDKIADARSEEYYRSGADKRALARYLDDCIFTIFSAVGIGPDKGELPHDFAERLKREYGGISTVDPEYVMKCIEKEEFGHGLNFTELSALAEFLSDVTVTVYTGLTPMQKLKLRYIKHII